MADAAKAAARKPVYERFIEANEALIACFGAISKDDAQSMTAAQLDS